MSKREQILLASALMLAIGLGYGLFRARPAYESQLALELEIQSNIERMQGEVKNRLQPVPQDPEEMSVQLQKLQEQKGLEDKKLKALETAFTPVGDSAELNRLKQRISDLAASCKVAIMRNVPFGAIVASARQRRERSEEDLQLLKVLKEWGRPIDEMVLATSFQGLRMFLDRLSQLPSRVLIISLDVAAQNDVPLQGDNLAPLKVTMLVAR